MKVYDPDRYARQINRVLDCISNRMDGTLNVRTLAWSAFRTLSDPSGGTSPGRMDRGYLYPGGGPLTGKWAEDRRARTRSGRVIRFSIPAALSLRMTWRKAGFECARYPDRRRIRVRAFPDIGVSRIAVFRLLPRRGRTNRFGTVRGCGRTGAFRFLNGMLRGV